MAIKQRGSKRANVDDDGLGLPPVHPAQPSRKIVEGQSLDCTPKRTSCHVLRGAAAIGLKVAPDSGFYDHQTIEYEATFGTAASPQAALQISKGEIVYQIEGADGNTPAVQCARLLAALPNDATSCNTLNFIPTVAEHAKAARRGQGKSGQLR